MSRKQRIAAAFGAAHRDYDSDAPLQRHAAAQLAARIAALPLPPAPRILEIGCGTGLLSAALARMRPDAGFLFTDLAPAMLESCRARLAGPVSASYLAMDGERPALAGGRFDLICASLAFQWFDDPPAAIRRLRGLLRPGGWLAYATLAAGTLEGWRQAHAACGLQAGTPDFPPEADLPGCLEAETVILPGDAASLVRQWRGIGATAPRPGHRPLQPGALRRVMRAFDAAGSPIGYRLAYAAWRRPPVPGVFVTGTDTGIGKTLVSAVLVRSWGAEYWKPAQTGLAEEAGDTETVSALTGCITHEPRHALQAPLSPEAAASLEGAAITLADFALPNTPGPIVVEGAGGVMVPLNARHDYTDLLAALGLPAVLVARSTLGTINHTLLSLAALRRRGIPVLGVVLNGPPNPGNRAAIERHGRVRVIAEIAPLPSVNADVIARWAVQIPPLERLLAEAG